MQKSQSNINPHYQDCYFSETDGQAESFYIFIEGNNIPSRLEKQKHIHIGETGFGTGLNLLTLLNSIQTESSQSYQIRYSSLEKYPLTAERISFILEPFKGSLGPNLVLYLEYWSLFYENLSPGWNRCFWEFPNVGLDFNLYWGDASDWCLDREPAKVDAWFLDGHSPEKNPEIWEAPVMESVYNKTAAGGTLASFTASGTVKRPLRDAGFFIKRKKGFGSKRHMIQGIKS